MMNIYLALDDDKVIGVFDSFKKAREYAEQKSRQVLGWYDIRYQVEEVKLNEGIKKLVKV